MLTVAEIMTREPYTLGPDDTLHDARKLMADHHIRHIPVLNSEGALVGLVSQRDVLAASGSSAVQGRSKVAAAGSVPLSSIMTSRVQTVAEGASLRGTAMHLLQTKLGCLPVINDNRLVGIITDSDFVAVAANLMEQLEYSEPEDDFFDTDLAEDLAE